LFRSIQWRITAWFILVVLISMGILGAYLTASVRNNQLDSLRSQLESEARIIAEASLPGFSNQEDPGNMDTLAKRAGSLINTRVTIIAVDGTVYGDSDEDPSVMENHATRPEVSEALVSGLGESIRFSTTLGEKMMYVAVPIASEDEILGIARVALPITQIESSVNRMIMTIFLAMVITAVLIILACS